MALTDDLDLPPAVEKIVKYLEGLIKEHPIEFAWLGFSLVHLLTIRMSLPSTYWWRLGGTPQPDAKIVHGQEVSDPNAWPALIAAHRSDVRTRYKGSPILPYILVADGIQGLANIPGFEHFQGDYMADLWRIMVDYKFRGNWKSPSGWKWEVWVHPTDPAPNWEGTEPTEAQAKDVGKQYQAQCKIDCNTCPCILKVYPLFEAANAVVLEELGFWSIGLSLAMVGTGTGIAATRDLGAIFNGIGRVLQGIGEIVPL